MEQRTQTAAGVFPKAASAWALVCLWTIGWGIQDCARAQEEVTRPASTNQASYQNYRQSKGPWSIHVVRVPRHHPEFEIRALHAAGRAVGLATLSQQLRLLTPESGTAVAGINGDFYNRDGGYAGDPRGLQIVEGELLSAPAGGASFFVDAIGEPHATNTVSLFRVTWPGGNSSPMGLNGTRRAKEVELYTPAMGASTRTQGGREFVLEQVENSPWLPLRPGRSYRARVREFNDTGNTRIARETMVLSVGPALARTLTNIPAGSELTLATETRPSLRGVKTAISGGPVLVRDGKRVRFGNDDDDSYQVSSMAERHPRSAVGWNADWFFLVEVDGRQRLSAGMTLSELAAYMVQLGCEGAMNLDGGGSSTLWFNGTVQNRPCDGHERAIANCLAVVKSKTTASPQRSAPSSQAAAP